MAKMMINDGGGLCDDIVEEILGRLPIKSLFKCKLVCKPWYQLISTFKVATFGLINQYLECHHGHLNLDFLNLKDREVVVVVGGVGGENQSTTQTSYLNITIYKGLRLLGSCNGLLILVAEDPCSGGTTVYYVCNPILNKWVVLPQPHRNTYMDMIFPCLGFAFDGIFGHHYKIVYFIDSKEANLNIGTIDYEVFSSETGRWIMQQARIFNLCLLRNFGRCSIHLPSLYWQGKMYWIIEDVRSVMIVFHLEKEFFKLIKLPDFHVHDEKKAGWLWESQGEVRYCYAGLDRICVCAYVGGDDAEANDDDDCENKQNWLLKHIVMYEKLITDEVPENLIRTIRYITFDNDLELLYIHMKGIILTYSFKTGRLKVAWRAYNDCNSVEGFRNNGMYPYLLNYVDLPKWDGCEILEAKLSPDEPLDSRSRDHND